MEEAKKPKNEYVKEKLKLKRKLSKKNKHRARLIVRNLPFDTTEDNLREHFAKFGEIDEIKLLKKEDGVALGCGFVQFKLVQKAAKARHHSNGKPFLNRSLECDWALPKDKYKKEQVPPAPIKIKEEPLDDSYTEIKTEIKQEDVKEEISEEESSDEDLDETKEEDEEDYIEDVEEVVLKDESKPKVVSNDTVQGKTVFIKNVPFTATNDDVKNCMSQFGPLYYALVCVDKLTEHSRGTAFAKFKNKEDADKCLSNKAISLLGNILEFELAVTKDELKTKSNKKAKGPQDARNLYLVKEGVILAGSKAAESVSAADMAKRLQIEQYKTQMLRNLNMFVARTRLVVHNIPSHWNDAQLKKLFLNHAGPKGQVREAIIMRNMRDVDANGIGRSKEFAFISFSTHDAALHALRSLNNNPNVFSEKRRPIIAFSIENRSKLQARERRRQNSKLKNPNCKSYNPDSVNKAPKRNENKKNFTAPIETSNEGLKTFSGVKASFGANKMRSKFNLRTQAQIHHEQVKKDKKKKKLEIAKRPVKQKQKITKPLTQKLNKLKTDDNFTKMVSSYKQKLMNATSLNTTKKNKWYE